MESVLEREWLSPWKEFGGDSPIGWEGAVLEELETIEEISGVEDGGLLKSVEPLLEEERGKTSCCSCGSAEALIIGLGLTGNQFSEGGNWAELSMTLVGGGSEMVARPSA